MLFNCFTLCVFLVAVLFTKETIAKTLCTSSITGSSRSAGPNANPAFTWTTNISEILFQFPFSIQNSCGSNNTNLTQSLNITLGNEQQVTIATLDIVNHVCRAAIREHDGTYFGNVTVECDIANSNVSTESYMAIVTIKQPTPDVSGNKLTLKKSSSSEVVSQTKVISLADCPSAIEGSNLRLRTGNRNTNSKLVYNTKVQLHCNPHELLFTMKNGNYVQPQLAPVFATCGAHASWISASLTCKHGHFIVANKVQNHTVLFVKKPSTFILCNNTDPSTINNVELLLGDQHHTNDKVAWEDVNKTKLHFRHPIQARCIQYKKQGNSPITHFFTIAQLLLRFLHHSHKPYELEVGNAGKIELVLVSNRRVQYHHVNIKNIDSKKEFKSFKVLPLPKHPQDYFIELVFKQFTKDDVGNYTAKVSFDKNQYTQLSFEIQEQQPSTMSTGAKVAVALSVIVSLALVLTAFGCIMYRMFRHRKQLDEDSGDRIMIIQDNDDVNDDVFHDPSRAARIQEELLRTSEEPATAGTSTKETGSCNGLQVPKSNGNDDVSVATEQSEYDQIDLNSEVANAQTQLQV